MKLKHEDDVGKIFFIFLEFSNKVPIEFNANFGQFSDEILALIRKLMKPRSAKEIIALMIVKFM